MRIVRIRISNFRCIKEAEILPACHNVLLGPNNTGKTAILEALNLLLNPELSRRFNAIDENDFYRRDYQARCSSSAVDDAPQPNQDAVPTILVEAVLTDLSQDDEDMFRNNLVPWNESQNEVTEGTPESEDPFANARPAIRVVFEGWYDADEDDFQYKTYFLRSAEHDKDECPDFNRRHKRQIGFLIYRDFRALTRPITLEPGYLFSRLLLSQDVVLQHFEGVLERLEGVLDPMTGELDFASILSSYKDELERFLPLSAGDPGGLSLELSDRTRAELKRTAQLYVTDSIRLPLQKMGAGTRSLAILAILTLVMRRRNRGILALEEPETFLFPHAQRRVIDECLELADQTFITTHSPYVLERMPPESVSRVERQGNGLVSVSRVATANIKQLNLYYKKLRQVFCEALLGRGVVVAEGDSDRWWINGAGRILDRKVWNKRRQEALELQGIAVVSADARGDILKLGSFFSNAGIKTVAIIDQVKEPQVLEELCKAPFPVIFLRQSGLEDLLARYLPLDTIRKILLEAPHSKSPALSNTEVGALADDELRKEMRNTLVRNKGSVYFHEWIMGLLDETTLPLPLKEIVDLVSTYTSGKTEFAPFSLLVRCAHECVSK